MNIISILKEEILPSCFLLLSTCGENTTLQMLDHLNALNYLGIFSIG